MFPEFLRRRTMPTTGFFLCLACLFLLSTQGQLRPEISLLLVFLVLLSRPGWL